MRRIAIGVVLGVIIGVVLCVTIGCFNPFAPHGVDGPPPPKPTCGSFCAYDPGCIKGTCHGDPNTYDY